MKTITEYAAGGAVFKRENDRIFWLIQEAAGEKSWWQLPKGHIEEGESKEVAALREVREESGVAARVITGLGELSYFFVKDHVRIHKVVYWFLMEYVSGSTDDFDQKEVAQATFVPFSKAIETLTYDTEKQVLKKADELVRTGDFTSNLA